jgi:hypothetical protein
MADHCVRIVFPYLDASLDALFGLENALEQVIAGAGAGEFDGNEVGEGAATLYMYGPDADVLLQAILPVIHSSPLLARGTVIRRYGPPETGVREVRNELPVLVS